MPYYIVNRNAQLNGDHEVHTAPPEHGCRTYPRPENMVGLGYHDTCQSAVTAARMRYPTANGCYYCAWPCHTG